MWARFWVRGGASHSSYLASRRGIVTVNDQPPSKAAVLRNENAPFSVEEIHSDETRKLMQLMAEEMEKYGGTGIAAPQVGVNRQVVLIKFEDIGKIPNMENTFLFNPKIEMPKPYKKQFTWEACLSVPDLIGKVYRPSTAIVTYLDSTGKKRKIFAEGICSSIVQHELDHLQGKLYIDRIINQQVHLMTMNRFMEFASKSLINFGEEDGNYKITEEM